MLNVSPKRDQTQRQNDLILQSIAEGICVIDVAEQITFSNSAADQMLGGKLSELDNNYYEEIFFRRARNSTEFCPIRFALTEGETSHVQNETFMRLGGGDFLVQYICVPLIENGKITGAVITFQDVTERRDIERAIAEVRDTALENARTRAAFLANMSHEIRTPLNGIIGTTNLLFDTDLSEKQRHYADMLKTSTGLLLEIVNSILDYSKIEAGKLSLEIVEFDVRRLIGDTAKLFETLAHKKNLSFSVSVDEQIRDKLIGDGGQLRQVLNNLLNNAVKFTESGEISLKIALEKEYPEYSTLRFSVSDTGIGIDENETQNLFQPFVQADVSTTRRFGGTGLGLAICKEIVKKMNGEIGLESRPGKGSRFWFTAEFLRSGETSAETLVHISEMPRLQVENELLRILIVEDNLINREITSAILKQIGFESEFAVNGLAALEKCRVAAFDLVLMDCQMPEMDGFEASKRILQTVDVRRRPKIIALTANTTDAEREKSFAAGMIDFLTKPIDKKALIKTLNRHFLIKTPLERLDLTEHFNQHFFAEIIAPEPLKKLLEIEARGNKNFISEMLELYISYTETGLAEIEAAFISSDGETIRQKAHALKGSSANIGVLGISRMFEYLEENVQENNWTKIEYGIFEINSKFIEIKDIFNSNV